MRFLLFSAITALAISACTEIDQHDEAVTGDDANVIAGRQPAGAPCTTSGECAIGAKYCAPNASGQRVCQSKLDTGYGSCGKSANEIGVGRACVDHGCGAGATCASSALG